MSANTKIEWCDHTFNPWIGCTKVSPACDHCYAESWDERFTGGTRWGAGKARTRTSVSNWKQPLRWNRQAQIRHDAWENFKSQYPDLTDEQLIAQGFIKPERPRVFCASLADVFDNEIPSNWRADLFELIYTTPHIDWLLLTKRIGNAHNMIIDAMDDIMQSTREPLTNVWLGATICNQEEADRDISKLLNTPAAVRFFSIEPLLGEIDLNMSLGGTRWIGGQRGCNGMTNGEHHHDERCGRGIDWVIVGGESGKNARPMHPQWVRSLRDQCATAGVPFFFKQWGEWSIEAPKAGGDLGGDMRRGIVQHVCADRENDGHFRRGDVHMRRVGKKNAGRLLDGALHDKYPRSEP